MKHLRAAREWGLTIGQTAFFGTISYAGAKLGKPQISSWAMRQWCVECCDILEMERTLINGGRLEAAPQCVFIANHLSALDILLIGAFLQRDYRWLAKSELFKIPFLGTHLKTAGHIPVYRKWPREARAALIAERVEEVVAEGADLLFFPEGTRSEDGQLKAFRIGAFQAAVSAGLPVQPLVVRGTHEAMKKGVVRVRGVKRAASITALPLIHPDASIEDPKARAEALMARAHAAMRRALSPEA